MNCRKLVSIFFFVALASVSAFGQQTGALTGTVTSGTDPLPGVTVEARSPVLPQARVATTEMDGSYRFPILLPGDYTLTFSLSGMRSETRTVRVQLDQTTTVNVSLGLEGVSEVITVTAESGLVDPESTELKTGVSQDMIESIPVAQNYRDLIKLAPGVQYVTEGVFRGPAGGGSEQDNVYQFDGVNISMPQYGILNTEPSSHDVAQVSFNKGGAKAVDFIRAGGFTVDSVSKSGTNEFRGEVAYRIAPKDFTSDVTELNPRRYDQDRSWATVGLGGPILPERIFFYASYFRPTITQEGSANVYGPVPDYDKTSDELFGKLTITPTSSILLNASYRNADVTETGASTGGLGAGSTSVGGDTTFKVGILEGSYVVTDRAYGTFKFNDYQNDNLSRPDTIVDAQASIALGTHLDVNNLEQMGQFIVPEPLNNPTTDIQRNFNTFIAPIIERYGYGPSGARLGGGNVGGDSEFNQQDFFRQSAQFGFNYTLGQAMTHDLHVGYQWSKDGEDLARRSNGWGDITVQGGRINCPASCGPNTGQPVMYQALFYRANLGEFPLKNIESSYVAHTIEFNDSMQWNNWSFNAGVMFSNDILYGQGLKEDSSTVSGYVASIGTKYKMYEIDWDKQIQPRLGATWAYNGLDTVYLSYARYNPAVSSLPRAASWDRNTIGLLMEAYFDAQGNLIGSFPRGSSTGKLFQEDMNPRYTDEYLLGTAQQITPRWAARAFARYRYSTNFWEDTNNNARIAFLPPPGVPQERYIPDLLEQLTQIGTGGTANSYVVAELDGAFTKHWELSLETDYRATEKLAFNGSYSFTHYYGNFDQDNSSALPDNVSFVGSSNIADGAGRQVWDHKYGRLHSDRPHLLKLYGYYTLPWRASVGAFGVYQSGQAWEAWDYRPYSHLTGSTSTTYRYAEPAGKRRSEEHHQIDLNYTQDVPIGGLNLQFDIDLFNLYDNQTGYSPEPDLNAVRFGVPRLFYSPRRFQVGVKLSF